MPRDASGTADIHPRRVAVVGLGLMGGSLARALKAAPRPPVVVGWSYGSEEGAAALAAGAVDEVMGSVEEAVRGVDVAVLATPVRSIVTILGRHAGSLSSLPAVTDVGSVKGPVMAAARVAGLIERFVGGHPLAGHHEQGFQASRADLFHGAPVYLVQEAVHATDAMRAVAGMWRAVGARPVAMEAESHDRLLAWTSHLPQAAAFVLGAALSSGRVDPAQLGPGGRDTTRLAGSGSELWADIMLQNAAALAAPLAALREHAEILERALAEEDLPTLLALFEASSRWRGA